MICVNIVILGELIIDQVLTFNNCALDYSNYRLIIKEAYKQLDAFQAD